MRRFKYGQNFSACNTSLFSLLTPLGVIDVAPGESLTGRFSADVWSDTTAQAVMNRTYYDTFAFYVPYRLLWDGWTDFITSSEPSTNVPELTNASPFFGEHLNPAAQNTIWIRYAYNLIYNKYFKLAEEPDVPLDNQFGNFASQRQSTFHESCYDENEIPREQITIPVEINETDGVGTIGVDELRSSFSKDRFDKIRAYYGEGYTEFLASLGVKAGWTIAEEPEMLGKKMADLPYSVTRATVSDIAAENDFVGDPAGYFKGTTVCGIKNSFFPEHGLVMMLGVARMDVFNSEGNRHPIVRKSGQGQFWKPEYETRRVQPYAAPLFGNSLTGQRESRAFEDYRKPSNQYMVLGTEHNPASDYVHNWNNPSPDVNDYKRVPSGAYDGLFVGNMGGGYAHYTVLNQVRMIKRSPVKPPMAISGVS